MRSERQTDRESVCGEGAREEQRRAFLAAHLSAHPSQREARCDHKGSLQLSGQPLCRSDERAVRV